MNRRAFLMLSAAAFAPIPAFAATGAGDIVVNWYRLILELVRHTATYTPPVASRAFAYLGITAYEALASGNPAMISLAGQVNGLTAVPARDGVMDDAAVMQGALTDAVRNFFGNTGPTGQRAMDAMQRQLDKTLAAVDPETLTRSLAYGKAVADHILAWSQNDGGAVIENMGFPDGYKLTEGPAHWVPTSKIALQQAPLAAQLGRQPHLCDGQWSDLYAGRPAGIFRRSCIGIL